MKGPATPIIVLNTVRHFIPVLVVVSKRRGYFIQLQQERQVNKNAFD